MAHIEHITARMIIVPDSLKNQSSGKDIVLHVSSVKRKIDSRKLGYWFGLKK